MKMQGENGGLCYLGSGVEVIEANGGSTDSYTYSEYQWNNDPMIRATWSTYMENPPKTFEEFNNWIIETMPEY